MTDKKPCPSVTKVAVLEANYNNMSDKLDDLNIKIDTNHQEVKDLVNSFKNEFVLKSSFKVAVATLSALGLLLGLITKYMS